MEARMRTGPMDGWMATYLSDRARQARPGAPSDYDDTTGSGQFPGERFTDALETKRTPPKLWSKPPGDRDGKALEKSAPHSALQVALIHEKGGALSYGCSEKEGVKSYRFFFKGHDKKASQHSADISVTTHALRPGVAVISMNKMNPDGVPERAGSAMLLTVVERLTSDVSSICIDRLPKRFQTALSAACAPQKTQSGHVVSRAQFSDFLAGRLAVV